MKDFSIIRAIGSVLYNTLTSLNRNEAFIALLKEKYEYHPSCLYNDEFHLWYYPGTPTEIQTEVLEQKNARYKFPALFNYVPIRESYRERDGRTYKTVLLDLVLVATTFSDWNTDQREMMVFDPLLRPVYEEFKRQLMYSKAFLTGDEVSHDKWEVFSAGGYSDDARQWGEHLDFIRMQHLELTINPNICAGDIKRMDAEYLLVQTLNN